jgi:protoheme IX farnesyltransferase
VVIYSLVMVAISLLPWLLHTSGPIYGGSALVLGAGFLVSVWRMWHDRQDAQGGSLTKDAPAKATFKYSILYLFVLFAAFAVDRLIG